MLASGLGSVTQAYDADIPTEIISQADAEAGTSTVSKAWTAERVAQAIAALGGKIKQVVFTHKTDTFSTASTSFTDITGLSVSLTPTNSSNKVLVIAMINCGISSINFLFFNAVRDSTDILVGDSAGSRKQATLVVTPQGAGQSESGTILVVDSPGDTSAHTYKITMSVAAGTGYINRTSTDTNSASWGRATSSIVAVEYKP